jgi:hypothetical protein
MSKTTQMFILGAILGVAAYHMYQSRKPQTG